MGARFAMSLFSAFHIFTVVGGAKDVYLEKFGADATTMGLLWAVLTIWTPVTELIHGRLQDRLCLSHCFPVKSWGRRAPWLLTHLSLAGCMASVVFMPPSEWGTSSQMDQGPASLYVWFATVAFLAYWGSSAN